MERSGSANYQEYAELTSPRQKLVKSAVVMANELKAEAILVFTIRGNMARYTSWNRPRYSTIYALCETWETANSLSLNWGVFPVIVAFDHANPEKTIELAIRMLARKGILHKGNIVVVISSVSAGEQIADAVQMRVIN